MQTNRLVAVSFLVSLFTACADSPAEHAPDAAPSPPPALELAGDFALRSSFVLSAPPPAAAPVLAELASATDGPDDPSRFLIDRLVARLPEGRAQLVAAAVAPYVAAYVQRRIDTFAPELASGVRSLAAGLSRIAHRFGTTEMLAIESAGTAPATDPAGGARANEVARGAHRVITGVRFDAIEIALAPQGLADIAAHAQVSLAGDRVTIEEHAMTIPYGALLRLGFDRVVIPQVVPGAADLADALGRLVACDRLGVLVAEYLGIGSPELYAGACSVALVRLAAEVYERLELPPAALVVRGTAGAIDLNRDGPVE